jgi:hypothetical protein
LNIRRIKKFTESAKRFDKSTLTRVANSARSLMVAAGILLTMLGIGALMGWMGLLWSQGGFAPEQCKFR